MVKNRALGDTIITLGTLSFLKKILPQTEIFYFVPRWTKPIFENVKVDADHIIPFEMNGIGDWLNTFSLLRKNKIDAVLELSQAGRTGVFFDFYSTLFRVPYFFHNHHTKMGRVRDQGVQKAIIQRDLDAAWTYFGWLQQFPVPNYLDFAPEMRTFPMRKHKRVILGVVATRQTKMYPLEKYAELAHLIVADDPGTEVVAPLSESPEDAAIEAKIKSLKSPIKPVKIKLKDLPVYFKEAQLYIGNDTGLKHLAVAVDIPSVTLFGPEPPLEWHPYDKQKHPYFFKNPLACRYQTGKTFCPLSVCDSMICLNEFSPKEIWKQAKQTRDFAIDLARGPGFQVPMSFGSDQAEDTQSAITFDRVQVRPSAPQDPIDLGSSDDDES